MAPRLFAAGLCAAVLVALPAGLSWLGQSYLFRLAELSMIFVVLACSLNLAAGTAGLVSLGHAAFYALGAYTAALVSLRTEAGIELSLPAAALVTGLIGAAVAVPSTRLVRIFFTVASLSVGAIIGIVILNWDALTRGPMGLRGVRPPSLFGIDLSTTLGTYYVIAAVTLACVWAIQRLTMSDWGGALRALREDEQSAGAMGLDVRQLKITAFGVSATFAGIAGGLLAHSTGYISPDMFGLDQSILILTMVVVGGLGSVPGAALGAVLLILLPELARGAGHFRMVLVGVVLFATIVLRPSGAIAEAVALRFFRKG
ncbi:MAG: branched-chain amino acid ABC transporter permease [Acetobacteraceae bacterium]|nr:branched-chain amino acid ABC transporter permease [Acetobacteraceae bacterium]